MASSLPLPKLQLAFRSLATQTRHKGTAKQKHTAILFHKEKKLSSNSESEPIGELGGCKIRATATSFLSQDAENNNNSCTFFQVPQGKQKQSSSWRQQEGEREKTRRRKQANALLLSRRFSPTDLCATTLQYRDREHFWMRNANAAHFRRIPLPRWRSSPFQNQKNTGAETCDEFYRGKFDRK